MPTSSQPLRRAVAVVGPSGSGKTTLICRLLEELQLRGRRCAAIKHEAHRIDLDTEGKDSWRFRRAGGVPTLLIGGDQMAWFGDAAERPDLDEVLGLFTPSADVVLVEGFRSADLPHILLEDSRPEQASWERPHAPALASLAAYSGTDWPPTDEIARLADLIERHVGLVP